MKKFDKMLVAFYEEELNCHAQRGSWLYIANKKDTKKGLFRLPYYLHYFVSVDEKRLPSEYGVVKRIAEPITALDLATKDYESRQLNQSELTEEKLQEYEWFLERINAQPEHLPMGLSWLDKRLSKKKELRLHKKFFTGHTPEERKELFEW